jgi:hypothetical protein
MSDETYVYIHKNPERIDEILDGGGNYELFARIDHLIELVIFGAKVEFAPMNSEIDNRAIEKNYGERAKIRLASMMEFQTMAAFVVTAYIIEHWGKDASVEIKAVLSLFKTINPENSPISILDCLFAICDEMAETDYLMYEVLETLVYFGGAKNKRNKVSSYLIELFDHRHYRMWTLKALVELKKPDKKLVEKVRTMSNITSYDEKKQLNDMPEHEKKMSPVLRDQLGTHYSGYLSDEHLLQRIRESNLKAQKLAITLLTAWGETRG